MKYRAARPAHLAISKMVAAMVDSPKSIEDLVEASGLCVTTVRHYVLTLRREKAVRVAEWQADRRGHLSVAGYQVGSKADAQRPKPSPTAATERWRAWEKRFQANEPFRLLGHTTVASGNVPTLSGQINRIEG